MMKLFRAILVVTLLAFATAPFDLPITTVAFAGVNEDIAIAVGDADMNIFTEEQAKREKIKKEFARQGREILQKFNFYKGETESAIQRCDRTLYGAIKSAFASYTRQKRIEIDKILFSKEQNLNILLNRSIENNKLYDKYLSEIKSLSLLDKLSNDRYRRLVNVTALSWVKYLRSDEEFKTLKFEENKRFRITYSYLSKNWSFPKYPKNCTKETLTHTPKDDDKRIRKEDIKKNKDKKEEKHKERRQALGENPKTRDEDRIVEADEGGMLTGKALRLSDLKGCGAVFLKFDVGENFGWISTSCPGLTGGRVATKADYLTYCNSFDRPGRYCGPPGPGTEKRIEQSGIQGMPFSAFCLGLHFNILSSKGDTFNDTVKRGKLVSIFKYDNNSRNLECFYVSFAQSKALRDRFKNIGKEPVLTKPVAEAKPNSSASSTDIKTGITTTSVRNPDGTRTVTKTDKNGKVLSEKIVGKSPTSASSTDIKTGITTTSVRNPDGTRTVTKTDKNGKVLSEKIVGNTPASASSTDLKTNVTIKSVANPDGTRTVTTTDKDGIVLSREKVR